VSKIALIIGYGSIGEKHARVLSVLNKFTKIYVFSSKKKIPYPKINKLSESIKLNPDYIVIATPSTKHYKYLDFFEKKFNNKKILIEKPLFNKYKKILLKKNKYFVGYNLRFHPVIKFIKQKIKNKKIYFANVNCSSFLPNWRKKTNYTKSVSAQKKLGGGVLLELSHELDYLNWFFGEKKISYAFNRKISNLQVNVDDILCLNAISKKNTFINLTINFFSRILKREIFIEGKNISLHADLIKNKITLFQDGRKKILTWPKFGNRDTYKKEHIEIISGKYKNICSLNQGLNVLKEIESVRNLK